MKTIDPQGLLGKAENDRLEFKAKESLRHPSGIAREVAGFLNTEGGDVWIGIEEQGSRATKLDPMEKSDTELTRLRDYLLDTLEPIIQIPHEVDLQVVQGLIRINVKPGADCPYSHRNGGRYFPLRAGARLREMSRDEIRTRFSKKGTRLETVAKLRNEKVSEVMNRQVEEGAKNQHLWMTLAPVDPESIRIDLNAKESKEKVRSWLMSPQATGNRPSGFSFVNPYEPPRFRADGLYVEQVAPGSNHMRTKIEQTGQITFSIDLTALFWKGNDADPRDIYPYALLEYPTSIFRLASKLLEAFRADQEDPMEMVAGFALGKVKDWRLRPGSPRSHFGQREAKAFPQDLLLLPRPLVFKATDIVAAPDRCALRLIRSVYSEFQFQEEDIPPEFDRETGLLMIGT